MSFCLRLIYQRGGVFLFVDARILKRLLMRLELGFGQRDLLIRPGIGFCQSKCVFCFGAGLSNQILFGDIDLSGRNRQVVVVTSKFGYFLARVGIGCGASFFQLGVDRLLALVATELFNLEFQSLRDLGDRLRKCGFTIFVSALAAFVENSTKVRNVEVRLIGLDVQVIKSVLDFLDC